MDAAAEVGDAVEDLAVGDRQLRTIRGDEVGPAVVDSDRTELWMQFACVGALTLLCILFMGYRISPRRTGGTALAQSSTTRS